MSEIHCDKGIINKIDSLPSGMLRVFGTIANTGWLEYENKDGGTRKELVDEDVLFDEEYLLSLAGAPLTLLHPPEMVTPQNYKKYSVGSTGTKVIKRLDLGCVDIVTIIGDEEAIRAVQDGKITDLSCGYYATTEQISTSTFKQTKRVCNHNAIVPVGRASEAKLHLDAWTQAKVLDHAISNFAVKCIVL